MASTAQNPALTDARRALLARRIRLFVAATIFYNAIEAVVAIGEGARVSSTALVGFGLDSVIEVSSAAAVAWQFAGRDPEAREKIALRIIAFSFFGLATYVTVDAVRALVGAGEAEHSTLGILLAALSLAVMPVLSYAQRPGRARTRIAFRRSRFQADAAVHLPLGGTARRPGPQQPVRLVVG